MNTILNAFRVRAPNQKRVKYLPAHLTQTAYLSVPSPHVARQSTTIISPSIMIAASTIALIAIFAAAANGQCPPDAPAGAKAGPSGQCYVLTSAMKNVRYILKDFMEKKCSKPFGCKMFFGTELSPCVLY